MEALAADYFRVRDFEYAQPLYDLAFFLEVEAVFEKKDPEKYRTFSLWKAALSIDGYTASIDKWLDGMLQTGDLDCNPSKRIEQYLRNIRRTGSVPELRKYRGTRFQRCSRLRAVRGLGPSQIAETIGQKTLSEEWLKRAAQNSGSDGGVITSCFNGSDHGCWQTAHIIPPLLRFFRAVEDVFSAGLQWAISGMEDPFEPVRSEIRVTAIIENFEQWDAAVQTALRKQKHFSNMIALPNGERMLSHSLGWRFVLCRTSIGEGATISEIANRLDPLAKNFSGVLKSDLHMHSSWSDGNASLPDMAACATRHGLEYIAITDHSRSCKLQGGLTPIQWLRQANSMEITKSACPVLHGIEVDILAVGDLDLPRGLLAAADIVVGSVHTSWSGSPGQNTWRLISAIESGYIDILGHPTAALTGKPGVPNYVRSQAAIEWDRVYAACARANVALEFNCFPSRFDLPVKMLKSAINAGCWISFGSDSHSRSHLVHLLYGQELLERFPSAKVLNTLSIDRIRQWLADSRILRFALTKSPRPEYQSQMDFETRPSPASNFLKARISPPQRVPGGSRIVGFDLTAGKGKPTGVALLEENRAATCSLISDDDLVKFVEDNKPAIVSIDSPLGLPGGGDVIQPEAGIVRVAENDLSSVGVPAYPALIDSMKELTLRGIRLKKRIEALPNAPTVIESYPGAAQDVLCIPRKQKGLNLLRDGLRELGLEGPGLETESHDEMDAITSAIVGRYFEAKQYEPMGIVSEAQLIAPKIAPLEFESAPIICLAGKTGAGKSVVARYLSLFYGFQWIKTRNVIRELLLDDLKLPQAKRKYQQPVNPEAVTETDLQQFGVLILKQYKQIPLRDKLTDVILRSQGSLVVDSIRELVDVDHSRLTGRSIFVWFIDCTDSIIHNRLIERSRQATKKPSTGSPVDQTAPKIRNDASVIISNSSSLEALRWRVDDELFAITQIVSVPSRLFF